MIRILILFILLPFTLTTSAQSTVVEITPEMFTDLDQIQLANLNGWFFRSGHDPNWAEPGISTIDWQEFKPTELSPELEGDDGKVEGWFRIRIKLAESMDEIPVALDRNMWSATDIYLDGNLVASLGSTGADGGNFREFNPKRQLPVPLDLEPGKEYLLAVHFVNESHALILRDFRLWPENLKNLLNVVGPEFVEHARQDHANHYIYSTVALSISALLMAFFWIAVALNTGDTIFRQIAIVTTLVFTMAFTHYFNFLFDVGFHFKVWVGVYWSTIAQVIIALDIMITESIIKRKIPYVAKILLIVYPIAGIIAHCINQSVPWAIINTIMMIYYGYLIVLVRRTITGAQLVVVFGMLFFMLGTMLWIGLHKYFYHLFIQWDHFVMVSAILTIPISLMVYLALQFKHILQEIKEKARNLVQLSEEKKEILANQNIELEKQVTERTAELKQSLEDLQSTQSQLIHSEKMASLGELTAGIAHEIQNPLNFVNNFSEVNRELAQELLEATENGDTEEVKALTKDLIENEEKITYHGKRAEQIVKSMLQHSRGSEGQKEPTDINALCDEYLRLAYHGFRAKDKSLPGRQTGFNADFKLDLDPTLPKIEVIPQDIGRVLLNLINNAFQAVSEKSAEGHKGDRSPLVEVSTKLFPPSKGSLGGVIQITISDNGPGIPDDIKDKIFQPFFTTKPTGEGTGLGLSLSYDIVTKGHGGILDMKSEEGKGTEFLVTLPI